MDETVASERHVDVAVGLAPIAIKELPFVAEILIANRTPKVKYPPLEQWLRLSDEQRRSISTQDAISRLEVPAYGLLSNQPPPFSIEIFDNAGVQVVKSIAPGLLAFYTADWTHIEGPEGHAHPMHFKRPTIEIGTGTKKRFLLDLWPWINGLTPGKYELILYVHREWQAEGLPSARAQFEVVNLAASHRAVIRTGLKLPGDAAGRDRWLTDQLDCELLGLLPAEIYRYVSIYCLARNPKAFLAADEGGGLPPHLRGVGQLLIFEALLIGGHEPTAESFCAEVLLKNPELAPDFDRVRNRRGFLLPVADNAPPTPANPGGQETS